MQKATHVSMKARVAALTERQREVFHLVSLGCSVPQIAAILGLAEKTADNHRPRAMKVLGTNKVAALTRIAIKHCISSLKDRLSSAEKWKGCRTPDGWN
jgi:DNA-binding CsgD family transcriptional regulator